MDKIIELRKSKNLTQKKLAEILCVSQSYISRIETNKCEVSPFTIMDIAKYFNVSVSYLLGMDEEPSPEVSDFSVAETTINEFDEILRRYKTLNDEHKTAVKINIDYYYYLENKIK